MKQFQFLAALGAILGAASAAQAQYGLYGAPDMLPLAPMVQSPQGGMMAGYNEQANSWATAQPAPLAMPADSRPIGPAGVRPAGYDRLPTPVPAGAMAAQTPPPPGPALSSPSPGPMAQPGPTLAPQVAPLTPAPQGGQPLPPPVSVAPNGVINGMLSEPGYGNVYPNGNAYPNGNGHPNGNGCSGMIANHGGQFGLNCGPGGQPCGEGACSCCAPRLWYASVSGLIMGRDHANGFWTTYETNNNPNQLMKTTRSDVDWNGGYEFKVGRRFGCCGEWAMEGVYWGLPRLEGSAASSVPGGSVSTPLIVSDIEFAGVNGTDLFDGAAEHRLWRKNDFNNVEINLVRAQLGQPCGPLDVNALIGVRYFRFDEDLTFGSLDEGFVWGQDGGIHEAYLRDKIENNLIGVQIGFDAGYRIGQECRLFIAPKLGIYNNHVHNHFDLHRGDGVVANPGAWTGVTDTYPVSSSTNQFSFLAEIDAGLGWHFAPGWTVFGGYRLIAATGIGLADNQVPTYVVDIPEIRNIDHNGSLVLHGAFAGVMFEF